MIAHLYVTGRVQGVGYRAFCVDKAQICGVSGWVRNRQNGMVEVMAEGEKAQLELFLKFLKEGPAWANVSAITPVNIPNAPVLPIEMGNFKQVGTV